MIDLINSRTSELRTPRDFWSSWLWNFHISETNGVLMGQSSCMVNWWCGMGVVNEIALWSILCWLLLYREQISKVTFSYTIEPQSYETQNYELFSQPPFRRFIRPRVCPLGNTIISYVAHMRIWEYNSILGKIWSIIYLCLLPTLGVYWSNTPATIGLLLVGLECKVVLISYTTKA